MSVDFSYTATPIFHDTNPEELVDICITQDGRSRHIGGRHAAKREIMQVQAAAQSQDPVILLGCGLGSGLAHLLSTASQRHIIVVDLEQPILEITNARNLGGQRLVWINDPDPTRATALIREHIDPNATPVHIIAHPMWLRLRPDYYPIIQHLLQKPAPRSLFHQAMDYPRFAGKYPKTLFIRSGYFLENEIERALERLDAPMISVELPDRRIGSSAFIESLLETALRFKPDFVLTINHIGVDPNGTLLDLLGSLRLPMASWFVDSPRLILHEHTELAQDISAVFSWDKDTLPWIQGKGFENAWYLPLATDTTRFTPGPAKKPPHPFATHVSFVGASMRTQAQDPLENLGNQPHLVNHLQKIADAFAASPEHDVATVMQSYFPNVFKHFQHATPNERLAFELAVTWNATRDYRRNCVQALLPFTPLIVGDNGWFEVLPSSPAWAHHNAIDYYTELPDLYRSSTINFNCTSLQMKNAVNQRTFDVPACGGCLLTDKRDQILNLFDPEQELHLYTTPEEAREMAQQLLQDTQRRDQVTQKARVRIMSEHDYTNRMQYILQRMSERFKNNT